MQTAQPVAKASGLSICVLDDLRERILSPVPTADWLTHIELSFINRDHALPGRESLNETSNHTAATFSKNLSTDAKKLIAVSRSNLIISVLHNVNPSFGYGLWRNMKNPDLFAIRFENGQPRSLSKL